MTIHAQSDYEFWFAAPPVTQQFVSPGPLHYFDLNKPVRLTFTTNEGPATVIISQPANTSFVPITVIVNNSTAAVADLTTYIDNLETKPANTVLNYGLHIVSDKRVTAQYEVQSPHNAETFTLLGRNALGYEFIIPSQQHYSNYEYSFPQALNTFEIVASEDSTTIKVVPKVGIVGHPANDTAVILLNRGQCWNASALSGDSSAHLSGSFVFADKPVAVTTADDAVYVPADLDYSEDLAGAQLIPRHLCGQNFAFQMEVSNFYPDKIYIYAFEDATSVIFNDSIRIITRNINRGDSIEITMLWQSGGILGNICHIQSDKPVQVAHYVFNPQAYNILKNAPQTSYTIVPPLTCGGSRRVVFTRTPPRGKWPGFDFELITEKTNRSGYIFDPPIGTLDTNNYAIVPGTNGTLVCQGGSYGNFPIYTTIIITNTKGRFQFAAYSECAATDTADYSKVAYYSNYSSLYLGLDKKLCPGDSILLDAGYGRDTYLWNTGDTSQTIWAKQAGTYWVLTTEEGNCSLSDTIVLSYYSTNPIYLGLDMTICGGDSTLLDAGPGRTWYAWSTGDSTRTIWVNTTGIYWVRAPDVHCIVSDTVQITTTVIPSVTNNPLDKSICSGDSTRITLTSNITGTAFSWSVTGSSPLVTGFSPGTGDTINQKLTSTSTTDETVTYWITPHTGNCDGDSVAYVVTVQPGDSVAISIAASQDTVCEGTSVTFTATPVNGGTMPVFQWYVNGIPVGTNSPVFNYVPGTGDQVTCELTTSETVCVTNNPATSNSILMVIDSNLLVSVSISASANPVCEGTSVTYTATPVNGGITPVFQWYVNGTPVGTNNPVFNYVPGTGDQVTCDLTSSETVCVTNNPATSNTVTMTINPNNPVNVSIAASEDTVCAGTSVTFTATPVNGGIAPVYYWYINGVLAGTNSPVYSYMPANLDLVTCSLLSSETVCVTNNPATSNTITMTVNPNIPVSVSIAASTNPVCSGTSVTFTATPVNGGIAPVYYWYINGVLMGTNSPVFTYVPVNGDAVNCELLSSENICVSNNPATSNQIIITVNPNLPVSVSIVASANPVCEGTSVTYTATPINGGTTPVFQWYLNGIPLGTNSPVFTYVPSNGNSVYCLLTSDFLCTTGNPATSNPIVMNVVMKPGTTFTACFDTITSVNAKPIKLKGGIPLGGTYSGAGVNTGIFYPAIAGAGTHVITYTYTNAGSCSDLDQVSILNLPSSILPCGNPMTDIRDNKVYPTIQIGTQCWLAANLNYGNPVPSAQYQRDNCIPEKYCYNDLPANCLPQTANSFYQWDELMAYDATPGLQGLCPPGWHVPTEAEWNTLFAVYINNAFAGSPLKYSGYSGFNALLTGAKHFNKAWNYSGFAAFFWSSTSWGTTKAWAHGMNDPDPSVSRYPSYRTNAFSVRCLKD